MRYVVYGAGAVGGVLGGMLALCRRDVTLICRPSHARAIMGEGLRLRSATGDYAARPVALDSVARVDFDGSVCVLVATKAHDAPDAIERLSHSAPEGTPVFTFQNGVDTEPMAASHFNNVYGGVCRMTCSMLQPGHVTYRRLGRLVVGKFPRGSDATLRAVADDFEEAGFSVGRSRAVMNDKWLKLAVNAQSVFNAVIDPRDHDANEFFEIKARILEETRDVFRAAKVRARSCDGADPSIDEMIESLRRPRGRRGSRGMKVGNSVWQDLYLRRPKLEAEYIHGPVVSLADEHGVDVPFHRAALEFARRALEQGDGPETIRLREVLNAVGGFPGKAGS